MFSLLGDKAPNSGLDKSHVDMEYLLQDDDI
jgi:hypothetical protein